MTDVSKIVAKVPPSLQQQVKYTETELAEMRANAEAWIADPEAFKRRLYIDVLVLYQAFYKIATNPPGGRSGATTAARAAQQVVAMAEKLIDADLKVPPPPPSEDPPPPNAEKQSLDRPRQPEGSPAPRRKRQAGAR